MGLFRSQIKHFVLFLLPFVLCIFACLILLRGFGLFQQYFSYPIGSDGSPTFPSTRELVIYNGVQFIFLAILFVACAYIYSRFIKHIEGPAWKVLLTIGISWALWTFVTYGLATFFCCPGLFPDAFNKFYWLTLPEFILLGMLGGAYLGKKIVYR